MKKRLLINISVKNYSNPNKDLVDKKSLCLFYLKTTILFGHFLTRSYVEFIAQNHPFLKNTMVKFTPQKLEKLKFTKLENKKQIETRRKIETVKFTMNFTNSKF